MQKEPIQKDRKKNIKKLLAMMNKQGKRLMPVTPPLVALMDLAVSDAELDFLVRLASGSFSFDQAQDASKMQKERFKPFFDKLITKGLICREYEENGETKIPAQCRSRWLV